MNTILYFHQNEISVSSQQLVVSGKSYPLDKIQTIRFTATNIWRGFSILAMVLGFLLMVDEGTLFVIGGVLFIGGILTLLNTKPSYLLWISTHEGESPVLKTKDKFLLHKVIEALDVALTENRSNSMDNAPSYVMN
jgi:hypothetical protein